MVCAYKSRNNEYIPGFCTGGSRSEGDWHKRIFAEIVVRAEARRIHTADGGYEPFRASSG